MIRNRLSRRGVFNWAISVFAGGLLPPVPAGAAAPTRALDLIETHVAGTAYYDAACVIDALRPGDALALRREPGNPHDASAIEVFTVDGVKLGYVPRLRNPPFAALMDDGQTVTARIASLCATGRWTDIRFTLALVLPAR